ncbi:hypothetical protein [Bradyrhizobium sp. Tv2a-2]|uniref:hypothetical protein n=1 Tax=Bradyrhizobium sp. Tv2a-2 TaxID=113395 RepID=UPI00041976D4|nr:hypothetical protein [Bradyrhizobium sp. Tv2a-2]
MVLKAIVPVLVGAALVACSVASAADDHPDEFLGLDLSKALLSPKPLGPVSTFAPVPVEARSDTKSDTVSGVLPHSDARKIAVERVRGVPVRNKLTSAARHDGRLARAQGEKPRGAARARLAHRHGDPLNAQAMDTRIQKWPCNPDNGGICAWQR